MKRSKIFMTFFVLLIGILVVIAPNLKANAQSKGPSEGEYAFSYISYGAKEDLITLWNADSSIEIGTVKGLTYDKKTNTITLSNLSGNKGLYINEMGDDLKIVLEGKNSLGKLVVWGYGYGGSATISGNGSLDIEEGLNLICEEAESNLTICKGVTITANKGIYADSTTMKNPIVLQDGVSILEGGKIVSSKIEVYEKKEYKVQDEFFDQTQWVTEYTKDGKTIYVGNTLDIATMKLKKVEYKLVDGKLVLVGDISDKELEEYSAKVVGYLYSAAITNKSSIGTDVTKEELSKTVISSSASSDNKSAKPDEPTISATAKKKAAKITVKPTENADGYFIYMAKSETGKYSKIKATTTTKKNFSFTKKKLTKGKTYYFKARAYKLVDGKKVWGSYSTVKKVTVK